MTLLPATTIDLMIQDLTKIPETAEKDFIELGTYLQTLAAHVSNLVDHTGQAAELLQGSDNRLLDNTLDLADSVIRSLEKDSGIIQLSVASISEIIDRLNRLKDYQSGIDQISRYLSAIAFNFVVETSRDQDRDNNFSILSQEIKSLAEEIRHISDGIRQDSESALSRFSATNEMITRRMTQTGKMAEEAKKRLQTSIEDTRKLMALASSAIETSNRSSVSIQDQISHMIISVQMHDNIRQRIDHISQGLNDISLLLTTEQPIGKREYSIGARPGIAYQVLQIQISQLETIIRDIESVCRNNSKNFDIILKSIDQFTSGLFKAKDSNQDKALTVGITDSLDRIGSLKTEEEAMISDIRKASAQTIENSRHLSGYITKVHTVSQESQIKALNAIIAADKLMASGATLKVLAREMRTMTDGIDDFTIEVGQVLDDIRKISDTLSRNTSESEKKESGNGSGTISDSLSAITGIFETLHSHTDEIRKKGENIKSQTCLADESMIFLKSMAADLYSILSHFKEFKAQLEPLKSGFTGSLGEDPYFLNRYTMEQERHIHKGLTRESHILKKGQADPKKEAEFDDNIDLF